MRAKDQEQTPGQRARWLAQAEVATPGLITQAPPFARQLYVRFIQGELSWAQVCALRDAPRHI